METSAYSHPQQSPLVGVIMGSTSDWPCLRPAAELLDEFKIPWERGIFSAHRVPDEMSLYARTAKGRGLKVIIASAGGAAHLPGMVASKTPLPVIGVPRPAKLLDGMDSLCRSCRCQKAFQSPRWASGRPEPQTLPYLRCEYWAHLTTSSAIAPNSFKSSSVKKC